MSRLLIVEDEKDIREVIVETLSGLNITIDQANDGLEAKSLIQSKPYDAILSDINMPKMSGIELLKFIRSENIQTPFIVLTAYGDKNLAIQALKLGAFDFIDKPWESNSLIEAVTKALELGAELNRWVGFDDLQKDLTKFKDNNSSQSEKKLLHSLSIITLENQKLKKKIESKE